MRKFFSCIVVLIIMLLGFTSCESSYNYSKLLDKEDKLIAEFMKRNDYVLLRPFPTDSVFAENEFVNTEQGLYFLLFDKVVGDTD